MKKRILCLAMALCMIAALLPISALAAANVKATRFRINYGTGSGKNHDGTYFTTAKYYLTSSTDGTVTGEGSSSNYNIAIQQTDGVLTIRLKDAYLLNKRINNYAIWVDFPGPVVIELEGTNVIDNDATNVPACLRLVATGGTTITSVNGGTLRAEAKGYYRNKKNGSVSYNTYYPYASVIDTNNDLTIQNVEQMDLSITTYTYDPEEDGIRPINHGIRCSGNLTIDNSTVNITNDFGAGIQMSTTALEDTLTNGNVIVENGAKLNIDVTSTAISGSNASLVETAPAIRMGGGTFEIDAANGTEVTLKSATNAFNKTPVLTGDYTATASANYDGDAAATYDRTAGEALEDNTLCYFNLEGTTASVPTANFEATRLVAENDLTLHFRVEKEAVEAAGGTHVKIEREYNDGTATESNIYALSAVAKDDETDDAYMFVAYENIAAKEMGDEVTVTICDAEGNAKGEPWKDSVATYAKRTLADMPAGLSSAKEAALEILLADMLHYGAMAQAYKDYNTAELVNAGVTQGTADMGSVGNSAANVVYADGYSNLYAGTSFYLESSMKMAMRISKVDGANVTAKVTYTHWNTPDNNPITVEAIEDTEVDHGNYHAFYFDGLVAADGRETVTWEFYVGEDLIMTVTDSMDNYIGRSHDKFADQLDLTKVMNYSDAALAYFEAV